ncbi:hypothetical protein L2E82_51321 [Cichorium intybus]|nr:hypothetical protein L2E82_51321 [Cichorium intybus]
MPLLFENKGLDEIKLWRSKIKSRNRKLPGTNSKPQNELLFAEIEYMQKRMLSAQTTYSCSISEDSCQKRKQIRSEAAD